MNYLTCPTWLARLLQRLALRRSRMGRMLDRRGMGIAEYTRARPFLDIEAQLARCAMCSCKALCDRALASRSKARAHYGFCPNARFIDATMA